MRGVSSGVLGYVGKAADGKYEPFIFGSELNPNDMEFTDVTFIITKETALSYKQQNESPRQDVPDGKTTEKQIMDGGCGLFTESGKESLLLQQRG